ncbi:Carbohydrate sulfotransferase 3 [Chionoecetes opilio]|uniref:Carbohydrate sulfotransferase 3 n=1 Tax=Chionoecetes opilio TaxID=41210 RepID=A0A8J5D3N2_CHIOP|nr:Carbohydrate sulfotransferase 3 [Chionoecetes opilio]
MASSRRTLGVWRRRVAVAVMAMVFMVLGYTGVAVMRSPYYLPYSEGVAGAAGGAAPARRGSDTQGEAALVAEEARATTSLHEDRHAAPLVVLVLSSMPRGGSTLLVELLSTIQESVVLFEPLWFIEKIKCFEDEACLTTYLADVFSCSFKEDFETWLKGKGLFFHYFNEQARHCLAEKNEAKATCLKDMNLRALCAAAPVVLVKVIRARLALLHNMLEDTLINLKVIHLTRDPRGSLNSIVRFGWNSDPQSRCGDLEDDLKTFEKVRQVFPSRVMQVRYEQLCLAPEATTRDIFSFLYANATLPGPVSGFLAQHMLSGVKKKGNMSTFKNSTQEFQAWRLKISENQLKVIEKEPTCQWSIKHMGHALFGSLAAANNLSLPLIINT